MLDYDSRLRNNENVAETFELDFHATLGIRRSCLHLACRCDHARLKSNANETEAQAIQQGRLMMLELDAAFRSN
jgi:hypothetical protein